MRIVVVIASVLLALAGCRCGRDRDRGGSGAPEHVVLDTVAVAGTDVQFYQDLGVDSAVLGFSVPDENGKQRYFPMYASTYRGLPPVELQVYASRSGDEMWVRSSWSGYEVLAYHRMGTDRCETTFGQISSYAEPTPAMLGGGPANFPAMDEESVTQLATIELP